MTPRSTSGRRRGTTIALWILTGLLALEFVGAGSGKLFLNAGWQREFHHWGFPMWFVPIVGAIEVGGAVLLLWPRVAIIGGALLSVTMIGATVTHAIYGEWSRLVFTVILCVLSTIVALARRSDLRVGELRRPAVAPAP